MSKIHVELANLEEVRYLAAMQKFQYVCTRESNIKGLLKALNSKKNFENASLEEEFSARSIGVDVLWNTWIQNRRSSLLSELSSTLAVKDALLRDAQYAMARVQASEVVADDSQKSVSIRAKKSKAKRLGELTVIRELRNGVIK